ncbi:MAG: SDR family oxidoreductase [Clostridia bacterium]|nr:SDR family oxidoreductase [Clostridia bacterium]
MYRLKDKIAVVTGGSSGIGKAIVEAFEKEGAIVCVFDIKGAGENFYKVDVSQEAEIKTAIESVVAKHGRIDVLVNNAGIPGAYKSTHELEAEEWDKLFNVNARGAFLCSKYVIPQMCLQGGGSIVNMSSIFGAFGSKDNMSAYHAAKGAIMAMTKQDAVTYGRYGIRVNAILPGAIVTPLLQNMAELCWKDFDAYCKYVSKQTPIGRMGKPEDIAYGAVYLASEEASFVTGTLLYIDGGYTSW